MKRVNIAAGDCPNHGAVQMFLDQSTGRLLCEIGEAECLSLGPDEVRFQWVVVGTSVT